MSHSLSDRAYWDPIIAARHAPHGGGCGMGCGRATSRDPFAVEDHWRTAHPDSMPYLHYLQDQAHQRYVEAVAGSPDTAEALAIAWDPPTIPCPHCEIVWHTQRALDLHLIEKHGAPVDPNAPLRRCPYCQFETRSPDLFVAHVGPTHAPGLDPGAFANHKRPWRVSPTQSAIIYLAIGLGAVVLIHSEVAGLIFIGCCYVAFQAVKADEKPWHPPVNHDDDLE